MNESRIEPRLLAEIRRLQGEGRVDERVSVLVQIATGQRTDDATTYAALEKRMRAGAQAVKQSLERLGFNGEIRENVLAGSLELQLTIEQIAAVSDVAEVKRVVWNRVDNVATAAEV